jgi:hypothetical protein
MMVGVIAAAASCAPVDRSATEVQSNPPEVKYDYTTDDGLLAANEKARVYCSQYASAPSIKGSIIARSDNTKTVTFECVKSTTVVSPTPLQAYSLPSPSPTGYVYHSDEELLRAAEATNAYCERTGQNASTRIVTNPDGVRVLTFQCVPR